ncbi:MAG TPA: 1-acyl-sn-glycerol-3-phosphate acyltransferase, partial [Stellaceae bacterium]|nr:1-acyl-sn-glycerol-3-phosphate acyltransferase [Stellaceae bacterium]
MDWKLKPAGDFGLSLRERLGSLRRELGFLGTATHWCWREIVRLYLRVFHRLRVEGREHLPEAPFVMIANHASHLDTL